MFFPFLILNWKGYRATFLTFQHLTEFRESSFNMTRGGGDEDIGGGLLKFLDTRRRGSGKKVALNLYT